MILSANQYDIILTAKCLLYRFLIKFICYYLYVIKTTVLISYIEYKINISATGYYAGENQVEKVVSIILFTYIHERMRMSWY